MNGDLHLAPAPTPTVSADTVAAVDLGSNSFHLIVGRTLNGQLQVLDRLQETVRLAGGLDARDRLNTDTRRRALGCLERFGQRLRGLARSNVRAVGTQTLRRMRGAAAFLASAERALGYPIEVISGQEEARLIYHGVARQLPDERKRLVIDIGGGSTELILGQAGQIARAESLRMGCVVDSLRYFKRGAIRQKNFERAEAAAQLLLTPLVADLRKLGWQEAIGTSGTIRAVATVLAAEGLGAGDVTAVGLKALRDRVLDDELKPLDLRGLSAERAPVFAGGLAILCACFTVLGLDRLRVADVALREGLLYDLLGRLRDADVREQTITALAQRYHVDLTQAARVAATAQQLHQAMAGDWGLTVDDGRLLVRAARLHEIGLAIAHDRYHKHGAYLLRHSELPGFSLAEQEELAALVRSHRRRFAGDAFADFPRARRRQLRRLAILLRLAALLHRSREDGGLPPVKLSADDRRLKLRFPRGWLKQQPLTQADLASEARYLAKARLTLDYG